jgi:hypothetical protein
LADGNWYKLEINNNGVYKIDLTLLKSFGIETKGLNPNSVRLFVSPEKLLPQKNSDFRNTEIVEIPVFTNNTNEVFDKEDFILFYAEDANQVKLRQNAHLDHFQNPYSDINYVFMKIDDGVSKKIDNNFKANSSSKLVNSLIHFEVYEPQFINILNSGRDWFGEYIVSEWVKKFQIEGRLKDQPISIKTRWISQTYEESNLTVISNKLSIGQLPMGKIDYRWNDYFKRYNRAGEISEGQFDFINTQEEIDLTFQLPADIDISSGAYLDFIELEVARKINFYSTQNQLYVLGNEPITFEISNASKNDFIWDVSQWYVPSSITSNSLSKYQLGSTDSLRKIAFFSLTNTLIIKDIKAIENQNIRQIDTPDLLIVYPSLFKKEANQLSEFRKLNDGLDVSTVDIQKIYNEFSGGKVDPTAIRDFARFLWLKKPEKLKYLLLFGDTNFDYKNINDLAYVFPERLIPTYESKESLEPVYSYSSDDYFGFLEDHEGEWPEGHSIKGRWQPTTSKDHSLDISVGRLPVKERIEAKLLVDKLIYYSTSKSTLGNWKRKISFVADDADLNIHQRDAERFSEISSGKNMATLANKIYLDAFPQTQTPLGERSPEANSAFQKAINEGSLIINYNGHGSEDGWTDEKLLTLNDIVRWRNKNRMPVFFTATCEFGRFDNPRVVSGAEAALLNPDGGAIALLTTTRPVFSSTNFKINQAFYNRVFDIKEGRNSLGDIFKTTKNNSIEGVINRNFSLLGDPSMAIAYPKNTIDLETINGVKPESYTVQGRSKIRLSGKINDELFNGKVNISLFDKPLDKNTFGGNNYPKMSFKSIENKLFEGVAPVRNGTFEIEFIVPLTSNEKLDFGQLYFYAVNSDSTKEAIGGNNQFLIGGISEVGNIDNTPPLIQMNYDNSTNTLLVNLSDESGINISNTLKDNLILIINDTLKIPLNDYYSANENIKSGQITYTFSSLPIGNYTARLKSADVYNNSSEGSLVFTIKQDNFQLLHASLFPNPSNDIVNIELAHNRDGEDLVFDISFFNVSGKQVYKEIKECYSCEKELNFGMNLETFLNLEGIYFYKINAVEIASKKQSIRGGRLLFWK